MKNSTRSQQSEQTKAIIRAAKKLVDENAPRKEVFSFIEESYKTMAAQNHGFFDNVQYQKAVKSVVDYMD